MICNTCKKDEGTHEVRGYVWNGAFVLDITTDKFVEGKEVRTLYLCDGCWEKLSLYKSAAASFEAVRIPPKKSS